MPRKPSGEPRTSQVKVAQKNGDIYVQERTAIYDPDKKRERIVKSRLIGKIPKGSNAMVPTRPKRPKDSKSGKAGETCPTLSADRQRVGMMDILEYVGRASGIDEAIAASTDEATAQKIISVARYLAVADGHTLPKMKMWQLNHRVPYAGIISDDVYHRLFVDVGHDETLMQNFFLARCSQELQKGNGVAYDSTTISTYSEQQEEARYGYNKAHDGLRTIKLLTLYSIDTRQPIAFAQQRGDIPDVTSVAGALAQLKALGAPRVELVTDNGYYSYDNLAAMLWEGFDFITLIKTSITWVKSALEEQMATLEDDIEATCPYDSHFSGVTVCMMRVFERQRKYTNHKTGAARNSTEMFRRRIYLHLYFDSRKKEDDRAFFRAKVLDTKRLLEEGTPVEELSASDRAIASTYLNVQTRGGKVTVSFNKKACQEARKYHGYFALVSNKEKDCFNCLRKYRKRETIEDFFEIDKQRVDGARPRVWNKDTLQGRLFVQFVALCYLEYLHEKVRQMKATLGKQNEDNSRPKAALDAEKKLLVWIQKNSLDDQLHWFDTTEEVCVNDSVRAYRWNTETTQRDRLYLEKLGVLSSEES